MLIAGVLNMLSAYAHSFSYTFSDTPISEAIVQISKDHPEITVSFIYKDLDNYRISGAVETDDAYEALLTTIGHNPISVVEQNGSYYIEALQRGKFRYTGIAVDHTGDPVAGATVMLLAERDSTVITYGITDAAGRFSVPCDRQGVIAKLTCLGYKPTFKHCNSFEVGKITMTEIPIRLRALNIESENAALLSDKCVYRPTQRQKNASQTAIDLLVRMAMPQLNARLGSSSVTTASGQPVAIYIDYVPASPDDLKMMNISDVRTVEYLEYSPDARFQADRYVINFRMVKYEYGGYVKALGTENFIVNSGFLQANARFVKRRMTFDFMGYGYYMSNNHFGTDQIEEFRLPHKDFQRESQTESSRYRKHNNEVSVRALYSSDRITANSQIALGGDCTPGNDNTGKVSYTGAITGQTEYNRTAESKARYLHYKGYYFFVLPANSSLTANLSYTYSHTNQHSLYSETDYSPIYNAASDNTHNGNINLAYNRMWSNRHSLQAHVRAFGENNRTLYSGSVDALDKSSTRFGQIGASYTYSSERFDASVGFGWNWLYTTLNESSAKADYPYIDASVQYIPANKNYLSFVFHYSVWPPPSNYKSDNIIRVSPFMWHTGNPLIDSYRSYDLGLNYTYMPSNKFNMTAFANVWMVGNRAAFVYEVFEDGIIRTIQQPIGTLRDFSYGVNASTNLHDNTLTISGQLAQRFVHNIEPFNTDKSGVVYYIQAMYYLGRCNFAVAYKSEVGSHNYDSISGIWTVEKDTLIFRAGWNNASWNVYLSAQNPQRWNWRASYDTMQSPNYSFKKWICNASAHAMVQLSATYTFSFGKKVSRDNDISRQEGASSGILK